jgi:hypothetical protein
MSAGHSHAAVHPAPERGRLTPSGQPNPSQEVQA